MEWREYPTDAYFNLSSLPIYQKRLDRLELKIGTKIIEILVSGKFSIKKRKVILHGIVRNSYKISINEIDETINYIGFSGDPFYIKVYPLLKTSGILFAGVSKKMLVNKRQSKIDILLDNNGKIVN